MIVIICPYAHLPHISSWNTAEHSISVRLLDDNNPLLFLNLFQRLQNEVHRLYSVRHFGPGFCRSMSSRPKIGKLAFFI